MAANSKDIAKPHKTEDGRGIFGVNVDPREAQLKSAKKRHENKTRRDAIFAMFTAGAMTASDLQSIYAMMLNATTEELRRIAKNEDMPVDIRRRARLLIGKDDKTAAAAADTLQDRAFGKPRMIEEIQTEDKQPLQIYEWEQADI